MEQFYFKILIQLTDIENGVKGKHLIQEKSLINISALEDVMITR